MGKAEVEANKRERTRNYQQKYSSEFGIGIDNAHTVSYSSQQFSVDQIR